MRGPLGKAEKRETKTAGDAGTARTCPMMITAMDLAGSGAYTVHSF